MTLHLARLPVDLPALARAAGERGWTRGPRTDFDESAALHHLLGEAFGPAALQPFRLIVSPRARRGTLYAYTQSSAEDLRATAGMVGLSEAVECALPWNKLDAKPMPDAFAPGKRLGFDLRLRPTVRLRRAIDAPTDRKGGRAHGFKAGAEVDAFLAEALRDPDRGTTDASGRTREAVYTAWLSDRLGASAEIEEARLVSFRRVRSARDGRGAEGPDAILQGTLAVSDPEAFADRLRRGVGRHRAYGYGMLMLRPPGRPVPKG
jgi:CRISPR system Cascade subunit CasE